MRSITRIYSLYQGSEEKFGIIGSQALKALKALKFSASKKTLALVPFLSARH